MWLENAICDPLHEPFCPIIIALFTILSLSSQAHFFRHHNHIAQYRLHLSNQSFPRFEDRVPAWSLAPKSNDTDSKCNFSETWVVLNTYMTMFQNLQSWTYIQGRIKCLVQTWKSIFRCLNDSVSLVIHCYRYKLKKMSTRNNFSIPNFSGTRNKKQIHLSLLKCWNS